MSLLSRRIDLSNLKGEEGRESLSREWLVTNGLGGYASGTIAGAVTWRYHGLLIAALPAPFGRMVMLNHLAEYLRYPDGRVLQFSGGEIGEESSACTRYVTEFRLEDGLPVWRYTMGDLVLEKHVVFLHGQNTVHISFKIISDHDQARIELRPSLNFRGHDQAVDEGATGDYDIRIDGERYEVSVGPRFPSLRMMMRGEKVRFEYGGGSRREVFYLRDAERGYQSRGSLWSPGVFGATLYRNKEATLIASTEPWHRITALTPREAVGFYQDRRRRLLSIAPPAAREGMAADLVLAADQFIITPAGRLQDAARAHAAGDEIRTVIAGYHWFTDWGRDTMISLEGLTLATNRLNEACWILRTFAHYIRDGLVPNLFPEGENKGLYHTADATLWYFHALHRYVTLSKDRDTLRSILPKLVEVFDHHVKGTHFGIRVDPNDGLLAQGAAGYQLTWMDAKVDGWVVTPRRGKAVELNGLWYNAVRLLQNWLAEEGQTEKAAQCGQFADQCRASFNSRFWRPREGYLFDIVDGEGGDDGCCRPNQILSFSLEHPVLEESRWAAVLDVVKERLLTPLGLRTLSRQDADYKPKYFGDLRARDAAYHQGTVWAWLVGPFIDAWLRVHPEERAAAREFLKGFAAHLDHGCVGSINEIFDAEPPFTPRGCIAQAWSVAEVLRAWLKTAPQEQAGKAE